MYDPNGAAAVIEENDLDEESVPTETTTASESDPTETTRASAQRAAAIMKAAGGRLDFKDQARNNAFLASAGEIPLAREVVVDGRSIDDNVDSNDDKRHSEPFIRKHIVWAIVLVVTIVVIAVAVAISVTIVFSSSKTITIVESATLEPTAAPTQEPTTTLEPTSAPTPCCSDGILEGKACCRSVCGVCGGTGCSGRPGGFYNCCIGSILGSNQWCDEVGPPCECR